MRRAAVTLSIALISLGLSSIPARAASIDGAPQIKGLQFDTSSVSVFGLNVATVKVSVHLTDGDGVDDSVNDANSLLPTPFITIQHIAPPLGVDDSQIAFLTLASGTIYDGWWQGNVYVPSHYNGEMHAAFVEAYDTQYNLLQGDPASSGFDPHFSITGTHRPDFCCPVVKTATTDSNGYWGVTLTNNQIPLNIGATVLGPSADTLQRRFFVVSNWKVSRMWWAVWAKPSASRLRLGSTTTVYGSVAPAAASVAELQRLVSGVWKTVAQAPVHSSGRFYLTAHPPSRGYQRYRVEIPGSYGFVTTATRPFTIYVY
ncbi:MAG: hypothetical protein E6G04_01770 [Actinobacteria bacterium]|nr:MAG: hypothetical protein E6G04_01770 [Actinomycetota bacterium]